MYISVNKDLVLELKFAHYKFARFLEGPIMRLGIGEALVAVAKFFIGL